MNWPDRSDNGTCDRCGKDVNMQADPPCPHGICVCDTCERIDVCPDCRREEWSDLLPPALEPEDAMREQAERIARWDAEEEQVRATLRESRRKQAEWLAERRDAELARLLDVDGARRELNEQAEATRKPKT
jgi:hypothetical protein